MPNKNRVAASEEALNVNPVTAVKTDHHAMAAARMMRGPKRSAIQPQGTWHRA
jgi:hypothetical protein